MLLFVPKILLIPFSYYTFVFSPNQNKTKLSGFSACCFSYHCFFCVFKERSYKPINIVDQMAVHFVLEGSLLYQDSDEDCRLRAKEGLLKGCY